MYVPFLGKDLIWPYAYPYGTLTENKSHLFNGSNFQIKELTVISYAKDDIYDI